MADKAPKLLARAQKSLDSGEPEAAVRFLRRASELTVEAATEDLLAEVEQSLGETERAVQAWRRGIAKSGGSDDSSNAERWLYIAQVQEGEEARGSYLEGIRLLQARAGTSSSASSQHAAYDPHDTNAKLLKTFCALAELYLTDLCFDPLAEQHCQDYLDQGEATTCDHDDAVLMQLFSRYSASVQR